MPSSLPFTLLAAWVLFFAFVICHQNYSEYVQGKVGSALGISTALAVVVGIALLIYYFVQVSWYWPPILLFGGMLLGIIVFNVLEGMLGKRIMMLLSFIGWPVMAFFVLSIVRTLTQLA